MWDLIVSVPDHCLSFSFPLFMHVMSLIVLVLNYACLIELLSYKRSNW